MIRAGFKFIVAAALGAAIFIPVRGAAAIEADPQVLYAQMKTAYQRAAEHNWAFADQQTYLSTILNAGRAYSLQRPTDPAYGEIATIAIQVGSGVH